MEISRLLDSFARKWRLIVLLVVLGGGISSLYVYYTEPLYQAETRLYIMNLDKVSAENRFLDFSDLELSQRLVQEYYEVVYSRSVISLVAKEVKEHNLSEREILSMISIELKKDSNIFTISARGYEPTIAADVANATGRVFATQIRQLSNSDSVGILDEALVPDYPVNKGVQKIIQGLLLGLLAALGIIYIIEYFDTTVRSAEDIEKGLLVRVIGIIPENNI
ncbi:YveK family protein [Desulfosporosinus meridiei]|uniref:Capsular polysaccharide biosynthesis protein n=1 Tax=Desulfosporosinus meridiei (strain ATCC BAA-275 / DSM 13257 / KCTC 12902 / NCIMB 13706 / S10) TaxID=768704 RepID=J7J0T4_DESMD|nr:Wzz/FepE/Etk N-terminal domain-containing protein [Desulfosporosinus meridiei]AFQ45969.1 capsular polysaccharide biosynthesis protein [Desulfosporosinus meridiei DSM 13257]